MAAKDEPMSKKQKTISLLYSHCVEAGNFEFDNAVVKRVCELTSFGNAYDATKVDSTRILPQKLLDDDMCIVHLGKGRHCFVKGIDVIYHKFETIPTENQKRWEYRESILNNINSSESNSLFVAYNQRILHDFLYEDIASSLKAYGAHRTKTNISYHIGENAINAEKIQIEIDLTLELNGDVCIFEAKNGSPEDFNTLQLFNPFKYYTAKSQNRDVKSISCCYLVRQEQSMKLYLYKFTEDGPASIELIKCAEYRLEKR